MAKSNGFFPLESLCRELTQPGTFFSTFCSSSVPSSSLVSNEKNRKTPAETSGLIKVSAAIPSAVNQDHTQGSDCSFPAPVPGHDPQRDTPPAHKRSPVERPAQKEQDPAESAVHRQGHRRSLTPETIRRLPTHSKMIPDSDVWQIRIPTRIHTKRFFRTPANRL